MAQPSFLAQSLIAIGLLVSMSALADSSWRQAFRPEDVTNELERYSSRPVGLRRIQRRPELVDPSDDFSAPGESPERANILTRAAYELMPQSYERHMYEKRSSSKLDGMPASDSPKAGPSEFLYVIAPISGQTLPFQRSKVDQGYKNFVNLAGPNYRTGLQRPPGSPAALEKQSQEYEGGSRSASCRATKANIRLTRDEFDPTSGQLLRQCAGLVALNSCEGDCVSSIQPSVKAPGGFIKKCFCCNERSLRQVLVRLNECWLPTEPAQAAGHMDVLVDEPAECRCRQCDSLI